MVEVQQLWYLNGDFYQKCLHLCVCIPCYALPKSVCALTCCQHRTPVTSHFNALHLHLSLIQCSLWSVEKKYEEKRHQVNCYTLQWLLRFIGRWKILPSETPAEITVLFGHDNNNEHISEGENRVCGAEPWNCSIEKMVFEDWLTNTLARLICTIKHFDHRTGMFASLFSRTKTKDLKLCKLLNPKGSLKQNTTDIKDFIIILITNDIKKCVVAEIITYLNCNDNKKNTIPFFPFLLACLFLSFLYKLFSLNSATLLKAIRNSRSRPKSIQHEDNQNKSLEQTMMEF